MSPLLLLLAALAVALLLLLEESDKAKSNCDKHRFVLGSSLRTCANVASRKGSGRHCLSASRALKVKYWILDINILYKQSTRHFWKRKKKALLLPGVVREAEVAFNDVFEESDGKGVNELEDHVAEDRTNRIESLVCLADICQSCFIQQNPLHNKNRNLLRENQAKCGCEFISNMRSVKRTFYPVKWKAEHKRERDIQFWRARCQSP